MVNRGKIGGEVFVQITFVLCVPLWATLGRKESVIAGRMWQNNEKRQHLTEQQYFYAQQQRLPMTSRHNFYDWIV